jgi:hypothetical protein
MSWRPEGWNKEEIKRDASIRYNPVELLKKQREDNSFYALPVILDALVDATADAMLKALRKQGKIETRSYRRERLADMASFNNDYERTTEHCIIEHVRGTLVFIPDDEKVGANEQPE